MHKFGHHPKSCTNLPQIAAFTFKLTDSYRNKVIEISRVSKSHLSRKWYPAQASEKFPPHRGDGT